MKRWQIIAAATGVVTMLSAGTALALDDNSSTPKPTPSTTSAAPRTTPSVSADQAGKLAVAKVGGGTVEDIERESEHGRQEWDVDVVKAGKEYDVRVDAATGSITRFRADDDRDDRADDRDDRADDRDDRADDRDDRADDRDDRADSDDRGDDRRADSNDSDDRKDDRGDDD